MTDMMITISMQIFEDMADRIEELEAQVKKDALQYLADTGQMGDAVDDLTRRHQHALHKIDVLEDIIEKLEAANKRLNEQMDAIEEMTMTEEQLGTIVITDTVEHEDGSATYTFDMDDASSKKITELGIELILTCAAYGLDIQDALTLISNYGKEKNND